MPQAGAAQAPAFLSPDTTPDNTPVWDIAVRVLHWSLVTLVSIAWWTGGSAARWHEIAGYTVLGLVVFRIAWGFGGTRHARFTDFVASPWTIAAYLGQLRTGTARRFLGHNPAGGAMILTLIGCLLIVCGTGWMMYTRTWFGVPWVEDLHHYSGNALLLLVPLHITGVVVSSLIHRENLVLAMITGAKLVHTAAEREARPTATMIERSRRRARHGLAVLLLLALLGAGYGWVTTGRRVATSIPEPTFQPAR